MASSLVIPPRAARLLAHLMLPGATARPCPVQPGMLALYHSKGGITLGAGRARRLDAERLVAAGLARWSPRPSEALCATADGARFATADAHRADARTPAVCERREALEVMVNPAESPLAWLRRRKGADGRPLIGAAAFAAGERLRADMTIAGSLPSVSANWSEAVASSARGAHRLEAGEAMLAARQRVDLALRAAGPEFAGLLMDVCGFLKGLPQVEQERGWPARSGRLVLGMALGRLAAHYGIAEEAVGPARARSRRWQAEGARPGLPPMAQPPAC